MRTTNITSPKNRTPTTLALPSIPAIRAAAPNVCGCARSSFSRHSVDRLPHSAKSSAGDRHIEACCCTWNLFWLPIHIFIKSYRQSLWKKHEKPQLSIPLAWQHGLSSEYNMPILPETKCVEKKCGTDWNGMWLDPAANSAPDAATANHDHLIPHRLHVRFIRPRHRQSVVHVVIVLKLCIHRRIMFHQFAEGHVEDAEQVEGGSGWK